MAEFDVAAAICAGKVRFWSRREAKARANKIRIQGSDAMEVYQCGHCEQWHLGHAPGTGTGRRHQYGIDPTTGLERGSR